MRVSKQIRRGLLYVGLSGALALGCGCGRVMREPVVAAQATGGEVAVAVNFFRVPAPAVASSALIPAVLSVERTVTVLAQREGLLKSLRRSGNWIARSTNWTVRGKSWKKLD